MECKWSPSIRCFNVNSQSVQHTAYTVLSSHHPLNWMVPRLMHFINIQNIFFFSFKCSMFNTSMKFPVGRLDDVRIELFHDLGLFIPCFSYIEICVPFYPHSFGMRTFRFFFLIFRFLFWILHNLLNAPNSGLQSDIRIFVKRRKKKTTKPKKKNEKCRMVNEENNGFATRCNEFWNNFMPKIRWWFILKIL